MKNDVKVLIADDHRLIVEGVRRALEEDGGFEIVGEAENGSQVLPLVSQTRPDVVVLDLHMPQVDGLICLDQIRKRFPDTKVVILSVSTDERLIESVLKRGASAYIVKSVNPIDLPAALRQAVERTVYHGDRPRRGDRVGGQERGPDRPGDGDPERGRPRPLERGDRARSSGSPSRPSSST